MRARLVLTLVVGLALGIAGSVLWVRLDPARGVAAHVSSVECSPDRKGLGPDRVLLDVNLDGTADDDPTVETDPRPGVRIPLRQDVDTVCDLVLAVTSGPGPRSRLVGVDAPHWGPASRGPWRGDGGTVSEDGYDRYYADGSELEPDSGTTVQLRFRRNPDACLGGPLRAASGPLTVTVSRWGRESRIPVDFALQADVASGLDGPDC